MYTHTHNNHYTSCTILGDAWECAGTAPRDANGIDFACLCVYYDYAVGHWLYMELYVMPASSCRHVGHVRDKYKTVYAQAITHFIQFCRVVLSVRLTKGSRILDSVEY